MLLMCRHRHLIWSLDIISHHLTTVTCPSLFTSCAGTVSVWQHLLLMWALHPKPLQHEPCRLINNRCLQLSPPRTLRMYPPTSPTPTGPHPPNFSMGRWLLPTELVGLRHAHMLRVMLLVLEVMLGQMLPSSSSSSSGCIILCLSNNSSSRSSRSSSRDISSKWLLPWHACQQSQFCMLLVKGKQLSSQT